MSGEFVNPLLRDALLQVAGDRDDISVRRLGRWLGEDKGRIVAGRRIEQTDTLNSFARWRMC